MRRPAPGGDGSEDGSTPHEQVMELEASIASRLAAARSARDDVERAQAQADALMANAGEQAIEAGGARAAQILATARAEAARLSDEGAQVAADLAAAAAGRRDADVAMVLARVLPTEVVD